MTFKQCTLAILTMIRWNHAVQIGPKCDRQMLESYTCNETDSVPHSLIVRWDQFCQLSYCYQYDNATELLKEWEKYAGLDGLFTPCDFVPFSELEVAAIFLFIVLVPIGLGFTMFCESRPEDFQRAASQTSIRTV